MDDHGSRAASVVAPGHVRVRIEAAACAEPELAALTAAAAIRGGAAAGAAAGAAVGLGGAAVGAVVAPGGAAVGRVVQSGDGAGHLDSARVLIGPLSPCGECDACRRGAVRACPDRLVLGENTPGALAGEVVVRARWLFPLGGGFDVPGPLAALIPREASDGYALCAGAGLAAGDRFAVVGRGPAAALARQVAVARGGREAPEQAAGAEPPGLLLAAHPDAAELERHLASPGPLARVAWLARDPSEPAIEALGRRLGHLLAAGGTVLGIASAHPDLVPEVAALAVRGELDLESASDRYRPDGDPLLDPPALAERIRHAIARGRALVVELG